MDFSRNNEGGRKTGRFVLVAALHVALGVLFVNGMNVRTIVMADPDIDVNMLPPKHVEPPPQVEPPKPKVDVELPKLFVPKPDVVIDRPVDPPITVEYGEPDKVDKPQPPGTGPVVDNPPPVTPPARPPVMHQAVLANADACTLPAYPKSSIRNEETGTTTLALLVGTDGRVTSARIEKTSGYRDLDRAALGALSLCQFKPATTNGVPEAAWAKLAYVWTLD